MFRKEFPERDFPTISQDDSTIEILRVDLCYRFAAPPARSAQHPSIGHRNNCQNVCFSCLQHFGHRGNLSTETKAARQVDADASVNVSSCRQHGSGHRTR